MGDVSLVVLHCSITWLIVSVARLLRALQAPRDHSVSGRLLFSPCQTDPKAPVHTPAVAGWLIVLVSANHTVGKWFGIRTSGVPALTSAATATDGARSGICTFGTTRFALSVWAGAKLRRLTWLITSCRTGETRPSCGTKRTISRFARRVMTARRPPRMVVLVGTLLSDGRPIVLRRLNYGHHVDF